MTIQEQLRRDEGEILHVYLDSRGIRTAGVGHNLESHGVDLPVGTPISKTQSDTWLQNDITQACSDLWKALPWVEKLSDERLGSLVNMTFNMGIGNDKHGLLSFHTFLGQMQQGNFLAASEDILHTLWAKQVGKRAQRIAQQIKENLWI